MIVSTKNKLGVFFIPKTGSTTISLILKDIDDIVWSHNHDNYEDFVIKFPKEDPKEYKFFCFYRDPIDRFISAHQHAVKWKFIPEISISKLLDLMLINENPLKDSIEQNQRKLFMPQVHWLKYSNVQLLDFRKFNEEAKSLISYFDETYELELIPNINYGVKPAKEIREMISLSDIEKIKNIYKMDYDFFNYCEISFI